MGGQSATAEAAAPADAGHLFRNSDFLRVWLGQVATSLGSGVSLIAMPLLILALTNSPAQAGLVAAGRSAPYLVLGLPAGAMVDRWDRRRLLICCEIARGLSVASVPIAWSFGTLTFAQMIVVAVVQGSAQAFSNIAQVAAMPRLVRREQITAAQALNTSSMGVASLIGPGLGGAVVALGRTTLEGAALAFIVDAGTSLVSTTMLATIRRPFQNARTGAPRALGADVLEGLRYLWADRPIRLLAIVNMLQRACVGPVVVLAVVVFGRNVLGADARSIGLIIGAAGAGGLLGSAVTPRLRRWVPLGWLMIAVVALDGAGIGLVGLAPTVLAAMGGMLVVGVAEAMTGIVQVSYRLATIPDALQGRVNSVYRMGSFGSATLSTPLVGLLIERFGARAALWLMSAYVLFIALAVARSEVRKL